MENYIIWSEIGSGFGEAGGIPPPRIPRSTQQPPPPPPGGQLSDLPRAQGSGYAREYKSGIPEIFLLMVSGILEILLVEFGSWALESGM